MTARTSKSIRPRDFFATHPVFTHAEFVAAHTAAGRSPHTSNTLLADQVERGRLLRVKRGLYATVPVGVDPALFVPDPYLVATQIRDDAAVAYHTALAFHGKVYSSWRRVQYMTRARVRPFAFRNLEFVGVQAPTAVRDLSGFGGGVRVRPHAGGEVRVTSLERCLVDLLHAPEHGGGWEEIWRSLEMVEFFDLDAVIEYTLRLDSALTVARVGFFLEQHREEWMVETKHLEALAPHAPKQPRYLEPKREPGKLVSRWNLVVPETCSVARVGGTAMKLNLPQLQRAASESGFQVEPLEKVVRLLDLLDSLRGHPFLAERLVLKGGTALNVFLLDLPRLSVDIDLNYIGAVQRDTMLLERPQIERAVRAVCDRQELLIRRVPTDHAGGKWRLTYDRSQGGTGTLELDLNFLVRSTLWRPRRLDSPAFLGVAAHRVPVLDLHELAAGKLSAFFSRSASRDLYDLTTILARDDLVDEKLRLAFVLYGAMSRRDWRTVSIDDVQMNRDDAERKLLPLLRADLSPDPRETEAWCARQVSRCRDLLSRVLPFEPAEREFLEGVNGHGEIRPELLTDDADLRRRIESHPALLWKAINVKEHLAKGTSTNENPDGKQLGDA